MKVLQSIAVLAFIISYISYAKAYDCLGQTGVFEDPTYCYKYHECVAGTLVSSNECPNGQVFSWTVQTPNAVAGTCTYPELATCGTRAPPVAQNHANGCTYDFSKTPDTADRHRFYECSNGVLYHRNCAPNLYWNDNNLNCDYSDQVTHFLDVVLATGYDCNSNSEVYTENARFTDSTYCNDYYVCVATGTTASPLLARWEICPKGTLFHPTSRACVDETQYDATVWGTCSLRDDVPV